MPRSRGHHAPAAVSTNCPVSRDLLRSVSGSPALSATCLESLQSLESLIKNGEVMRTEVIQSGAVESLLSELEKKQVSRCEALNSKQRVLQLRLLAQLSAALTRDHADLVTRVLELTCLSLRETGEECQAGLSVLSVLLCRVSDQVTVRLGEVLGQLTLLARVHHGRAGCTLQPASVPVLHFTQVTSADTDHGRDSVIETSESEMSDGGDYSSDQYQRRRLDMIIQKDALTNIGLIAKRVNKKEVVSFWFVFLPDKSFSPLSGSVSDLICHQNKKIRLQALNIMTDFLNHLAPFLSLAQHSVKPTSYTSLSSALATSLLTLHTNIIARLDQQLGPTELVALLKILSLLAEHSPYSRLEPSILDHVLSSCLDLSGEERNPVIQVATLSVFTTLCQHKTHESALVSNVGLMFSVILTRARPDTTSLYPDNNVRYMALQALAGLTNIDINTFIKNAGEVKKLIDISLIDSDPSVVLHGFRFIKSFAKNLTGLVESEAKHSESDSKVSNLATAFWVDFLKQSNFELLDKYPNANIKSAFCDCLAEVGGHLYSELPQQKRIVCISYILSQCNEQEDDPGVSLEKQIQDRATLSSSLRTLGIFIMYPTYLTDTAFHIDVADAVLPHLPSSSSPAKPAPVRADNTRALDPSNKQVKISASWALANLTDTLVQADRECEEKFPVNKARKILSKAMDASSESGSAVNTQSNCVRCIGNMLYYLDQDKLNNERDFEDVMSGGVDCIVGLIKTGKIMKIRWNACYAAGNVLKKRDIDRDYVWKRNLISCLLETVNNHQNFKVRINAAFALGCPVRRGTLGDQYLDVVGALVDSLGTTHSEEVAGEWSHMENLRDQIILSLCQLINVSSDDKELLRILSLISDNFDLFSSSLKLSIRRMSPEKCSPILSASEVLESFSKSSLGSREEVSMVTGIFKEIVMEWGS